MLTHNCKFITLVLHHTILRDINLELCVKSKLHEKNTALFLNIFKYFFIYNLIIVYNKFYVLDFPLKLFN